jgi:Mg-chelatase subunit ChlD
VLLATKPVIVVMIPRPGRSAMKTSLHVETHPHTSGHLVRALLRIEGEPPVDESGERRRVPLNLSLVLDRSGSMGGGKLEAVKLAARDLVRRLHPKDRVSVVSFDDDVTTVAEPGTADQQPALLGALMGLQTGGCTNLSGGWLQGRALAQVHHDAEGVNRVILLTDGLANQGITDPATLRGLCAQALTARVTTTTVGVGADYDEELLAAMAEAGGGCTYYIERLDQAGGVFEEELEGLLSIAAQNVTVSLRPRAAAKVSMVHHSYPAQAGPDNTLTLSIGDLYPREPLELLADFLVAPHPGGVAANSENPAGRTGVANSEHAAGRTGVANSAGQGDVTEVPDVGVQPVVDLVVEADVWMHDGGLERRRISLPVTFEPGRGAVSHPEVQKVFILLQAARARNEAIDRGDRGEVLGAVTALRQSAAAMYAAAPGDFEVRQEVVELQALADSLEAQEEMSAMDRKFMYAKQQMMSRSRKSAGGKLRR